MTRNDDDYIVYLRTYLNVNNPSKYHAIDIVSIIRDIEGISVNIDDDISLWICLTSLSIGSGIIMVRVALYDNEDDPLEIKHIKMDLKRLAHIISTEIEKYLDSINNDNHQVIYFENVTNFDVRDSRLWVPVYNYTDNVDINLPTKKSVALNITLRGTEDEIYNDLNKLSRR